MVLEISNVSKEFDGKKILSNISFSLPQGSFLCIKGVSGIGKTTLLNICAGMLAPDSGSVNLLKANSSGDYPLLKESNIRKVKNLRKDYISYVPCSDVLINSLTIRENLFLVNKKPKDVLNLLNIGYVANKYPEELSSGEYKRVLIARAIAMDTPFIFFDEPTSNLDDASAEIIIKVIKDLKDKGVIIATHDKRLMEGQELLCL